MSADSSGFSAALKKIRVDDRGRANIGSVVHTAKGAEYEAAVDGRGRILLTPSTVGSPAARPERASEHG